MQNKESIKDKNKQDLQILIKAENQNLITRAKLERLCKCDRILSDCDIADFGSISKFNTNEEDIAIDSDECDKDLEVEYLKLSNVLDLPEDTHSLTKIVTNLPSCLKYGFRSGLTHVNMQKLSPLTRGYQGPAVAVAAIATSFLITPHCWNEPIIDQVIEDGDTYYSNSYAQIKTDDRRTLTLLDLKRDLDIRKTHRISVKIDDPIYAGTFRSETPKDLHVAKALDLFFKKYNAGVLTSTVLNIAIWKNSKYFNIFDGQARLENCEVAGMEANGFAKLIFVQNLSGVLFIILEKSNVKNESFVLYGVNVVNAREISALPNDDEKSFGEPQRRPSGYRIQEKYRAVVQGSYHLQHPIFPQEFHGRGHLILAVAALIYSRLLSASKWTKVMIDLIFNQSNIYLTDLARVLGKILDNTFELNINDLLCDIILGVYTAKIKMQENVVPGQGNKAKTTMDSGVRDFFAAHPLGILEIKKTFYAIWKEKNKFYFLDPFACDSEGVRVDSRDPGEEKRYKQAAACVTMNSSVNQLIETILENTESKDKDPFLIHGLSVLYVKIENVQDGSDEKIIFREKKTNRRPPRPPSPMSSAMDECATVIDTLPRPRPETNEAADEIAQYPELMDRVELFMDTFDEDKSTDVNEKKTDIGEKTLISGYKIVNPHRLMLKGTKNCLNEEFNERARGRQGLIIAIAAIAESKHTNLAEWNSGDIDKTITNGNSTYEKCVSWIHRGSPQDAFEEDKVNQESFEEEKAEVHTAENQYNDEEDYKNLETLSDKTKSVVANELDYLDLAMLPNKFKIGDNDIYLSWKMNVAEGEANPLANLGEALEWYFQRFDQMILENRKLMYSIWKNDDIYFIFNPYGSDKDGWRNNIDFASLSVVDNAIELVNLLYGFLEFNDYHFTIHFIKVIVNKINDDNPGIPEIKSFEKYKTKFLPVTDTDLAQMKVIEKEAQQLNNESLTINDNVSEIQDENIEEIAVHDLDRESTNSRVAKDVLDFEEKLLKFFEKMEEPEQSDAPMRLNLALVTGIVKIEHINEDEKYEQNLEIFYEKLKYKHPPPFVAPPKKNLCDLLNIKLASKSMHSLLSRFSIDSKLAIKEKTDLPSADQQDATISLFDTVEKSKLITLPPKKYLFSKSLPSGLTPIRAINEQYIRNKSIEEEQEEVCRNKKKETEIVMVPENITNESTKMVLTTIIPLGPCILTPAPIRTMYVCPEKRKKKCTLNAKEKEDKILKKLVCSSENLLFEMMFPDFKENAETTTLMDDHLSVKSTVDESIDENSMIAQDLDPCGFKETDDENIGIINANISLEDRDTIEDTHYKSCYFAAILCILAKVNVNVNEFQSGVLDRFIFAAKKISNGTGKLRYKITRWFRNFNILGVKYNVILKQIQYADPENHEPDALKFVLKSFLTKHQTGIIVFGNVSYAFWFANDMFYLFDPYSCDENGQASADGFACLMEMCNLQTFLDRMIQNAGESSNKPYRLYVVSIAHLEKKKKRKIKKKRTKSCKKQLEEELQEAEETKTKETDEDESETSLIELSDWVNRDKTEILPIDTTILSFLPIKNYNASALEVTIVENAITRPILAPFKAGVLDEPTRQKPYDRKFYENSVLGEPLDLCVMAWSQIYDPPAWSIKTFQALYEASKEYALDSLLASEDTTVPRMVDNLLKEFNIANYSFHAVLAPLHTGTLYANEGWNLAMTLEKIFNSPVYTGAVLVCEDAHIGVMKKSDRFYAWWLVKGSKNIRIIVSDDMEDYLKIIVKEINQPEESDFTVRIVSISYAKIFGPNCSDIEGLHESMMPSTSIAEIHIKHTEDYNVDAVFRPIDKSQTPVFVLGSVALSERDSVTEPSVKRCYFVALVAVILKRDIIQNPILGMIDKVLELAENSYKLFEEPKYHTEHILKNVCLMDRVFDLRDCASQLTSLQDEKKSTDKNFFPFVKNQLNHFFKKCTSGIIHFSNCCYGFWYTEANDCYYYLDPYQCDTKGRRVNAGGKSCLCVFSSICDMVRQMCLNQFEETTGFFIHRVHVELVNSSPYEKFQEDPIWTYLDYHWSHRHLAKQKSQKSKKIKTQVVAEVAKKLTWKNYLIEVPNMIYSVWGTLGTFDVRFGNHAGKNQAAIGVALFAMRNLCHPSEWSPVVLDSAVICGDCYYKDSRKVNTRCSNRFNLAKCLKVSPYLWNVEFATDICGTLYGSSDQPNLADSIDYALSQSSNLLLKCKKKILTILQTTDAFYAMDSSWTGPPLFSKNHGASYVIRCKNTNTLVYIATKMLNTNQRIEFIITPVKMSFSQETCQSSDSKPKINQRKILEKPARSAPGLALYNPNLVSGSVAVPDEDSYLCYSRNLKLGLVRGAEFENPLELSMDGGRKIANVSSRKQQTDKRISLMRSSKCSRKSSEVTHGLKVKYESSGSIPSILDRTIDYPQVFNLMKNIPEDSKKKQYSQKYLGIINESKKEFGSGKNVSNVLDAGFSRMFDIPQRLNKCDTDDKSSYDKNQFDFKKSFIYDDTREMFDKYNVEMQNEVYKTYTHSSSNNNKLVNSISNIKKPVDESKSATISILVENVDDFEGGATTEEIAAGEIEEPKEEIPEDELTTYRSSVHLDIKQ